MSEMVYRTELRFNAIHVIESLRPGDRKTGEDLYDSIIFPRTRDWRAVTPSTVRLRTRANSVPRFVRSRRCVEKRTTFL